MMEMGWNEQLINGRHWTNTKNTCRYAALVRVNLLRSSNAVTGRRGDISACNGDTGAVSRWMDTETEPVKKPGSEHGRCTSCRDM